MPKLRCVPVAVLLFLVWPAAFGEGSAAPAWWNLERLAGAATVYSFGESPYNRAVPGLQLDRRIVFARGSEEFNAPWFESAPQSASPGDALRVGLGPFFAATSCGGCHVRNGRGLTKPGVLAQTPLVAQASSMQGDAVRAVIEPRWQERTVTLGDGTEVALRRPLSKDGETGVPLRTAPSVHGLGLLEAVDPRQLQELVSKRPFAAHGVRGQLRSVKDPVTGTASIGRFGWKAQHASLTSQVSAALLDEMGVVSAHALKTGLALGTAPEIGADAFDSLVEYMRLIAVPARRVSDDAPVRQGAALFEDLGCAMCHRPSLRLEARTAMPEIPVRVIHPFTDLLLHDMGEDLADRTGALRRHWRTTPLWGIGAQKEISEQAGYLHDGRARDLQEAVLWHGGEAQRSRDRYAALTKSKREALIAFLKSL